MNQNKYGDTLKMVSPYINLLAYSGSYVRNLHGENSDCDIRGVYTVPVSWMWQIDSIPDFAQKSDSGVDLFVRHIVSYMRSITNKGVDDLELLFTPTDKILHCDHLGGVLLSMRRKFVSIKTAHQLINGAGWCDNDVVERVLDGGDIKLLKDNLLYRAFKQHNMYLQNGDEKDLRESRKAMTDVLRRLCVARDMLRSPERCKQSPLETPHRLVNHLYTHAESFKYVMGNWNEAGDGEMAASGEFTSLLRDVKFGTLGFEEAVQVRNELWGYMVAEFGREMTNTSLRPALDMQWADLFLQYAYQYTR